MHLHKALSLTEFGCSPNQRYKQKAMFANELLQKNLFFFFVGKEIKAKYLRFVCVCVCARVCVSVTALGINGIN